MGHPGSFGNGDFIRKNDLDPDNKGFSKFDLENKGLMKLDPENKELSSIQGFTVSFIVHSNLKLV